MMLGLAKYTLKQANKQIKGMLTRCLFIFKEREQKNGKNN